MTNRSKGEKADQPSNNGKRSPSIEIEEARDQTYELADLLVSEAISPDLAIRINVIVETLALAIRSGGEKWLRKLAAEASLYTFEVSEKELALLRDIRKRKGAKGDLAQRSSARLYKLNDQAAYLSRLAWHGLSMAKSIVRVRYPNLSQKEVRIFIADFVLKMLLTGIERCRDLRLQAAPLPDSAAASVSRILQDLPPETVIRDGSTQPKMSNMQLAEKERKERQIAERTTAEFLRLAGIKRVDNLFRP